MTSEELYKIYAGWTGSLHFYVVKHLGRHVDVQFFPDQYCFEIYSGHAEPIVSASGVPRLERPPGESSEIVRVPRPEQNASQAQLDEAFRALCLAAARVLEFDLGKERLPEKSAPESPPAEKHALLGRAQKRRNRGH